MTGTQIADLVNLLVSTWPSGSKGHVWTTLLQDRNPDAGMARAAYRLLRDEDSRPPSPARFLEALRSVEALARRSSHPVVCGTCRGDRFVETRDERRHGPGCRRARATVGRCFCSAVVPCPACSVGHPTPFREESPVSFEEYHRRVLERRDFEELGRWERFLGKSLR